MNSTLMRGRGGKGMTYKLLALHILRVLRIERIDWEVGRQHSRPSTISYSANELSLFTPRSAPRFGQYCWLEGGPLQSIQAPHRW